MGVGVKKSFHWRGLSFQVQHTDASPRAHHSILGAVIPFPEHFCYSQGSSLGSGGCHSKSRAVYLGPSDHHPTLGAVILVAESGGGGCHLGPRAGFS